MLIIVSIPGLAVFTTGNRRLVVPAGWGDAVFQLIFVQVPAVGIPGGGQLAVDVTGTIAPIDVFTHA
jgi:hypothetical protein